MKITVSSTSMMKPILHIQPTSPTVQQYPLRIVGLLEPGSKKPDSGSAAIYVRSVRSISIAIPLSWQSFLQIPDRHSQLCAAVFGFEFDGERTWYQLWNVETNQAYWLQHEDDMDYQPYSIMAMDALVSLVPDWDGELHLALMSNSLSTTGQSGSSAYETQSQNQGSRGGHSEELSRNQQLLISDAATTATGQLWFLVTVQDEKLNSGQPIWDGKTRTGWISQPLSTVSAA